MEPLASRVDRYLPRSLIASLATIACDRGPPARALIITVERLAGGCALYRLGRKTDRENHRQLSPGDTRA